jgi:rhodanese-related sulfurtransferase/DNA-binding HxlR family transcriptional regulator
MERCRFKERAYELVARIAKAAASPRRLEILEVLAQGPRTVEALAKETSLSVANASQHLQELRQAGLVEGRKQGLFVEYRLADAGVFDLVRALRVLAERRLADVNRLVESHLGAQDEFEAVSREELLARMRSGSVIVLDVRPRAEYNAAHIAGAVSIPLAELPRSLRSLPARKEVVAYCRGPFCLMALDAVKTLRRRGRRARRLVEGFPEWRAAGLPVQAREPSEMNG